ncbi:MAG: hypothetical protein KJ787_12550 [Gammaproteobacteria bacterium]|nr:hypothetical protein [Gammaproteobacteria bacterium]MBU1647154.1 hypothetical protein [Gammaproteobacteria bacterium]MBU1972666.1 hypothetical protein [Gammaproteobacteria bacterium]
MHPNMSFEQAPPVWVPYRFFLTAPLFGIVAGLLLAWAGPAALTSRWTPEALALTHLLVAGFMLQAMCGALLQFVPVAAGANIWRPGLVAGLVHPMLAVGVSLLAAGFLAGPGPWLAAGAGLIVTALSGYVIVVGVALLRAPVKGATIVALRVALLALVVTYGFGFTLVQGLRGSVGVPLVEMTNVHAAWGLGGWSLLLLSGVSYYVVPMFQLTPAYPAWLGRMLPWGLLAVLLLWASRLLTGLAEGWLSWILLAGMALAGGFAVVTLRLQAKRRRRVPDVTLTFFRGGMVSLLAVVVAVVAAIAVPPAPTFSEAPAWAVTIGILLFVGLFISVITGMLYKIVPFLNWLHLQRLGGLTIMPPNMKEMIPERGMVGQMRLHFVSLAALLLAVAWPPLTVVAGLLFAASCVWLEWNLLSAVRVYVDFRDRILAADACHAPG